MEQRDSITGSYKEEDVIIEYKTPLQMMEEGHFVKCAAPMVRYSK